MNLDHDDTWDYPISETEYYRREEWLERNANMDTPDTNPHLLDIPKVSVDTPEGRALIAILHELDLHQDTPRGALSQIRRLALEGLAP